MNDCISREAAIDAIETMLATDAFEDEINGGSYISYEDTLGEIESLPAAEVIPVRWIPVTERLPETDKLVLVVRSDGDMAVAGWNAALGWLHYWSGFRVRNVTHWMPLPELPEEEKE